MIPEKAPVTGNEPLAELTPAQRALVGFYCAFNRRDLSAMSENWAQSDEAVMDNPLGDICRGWPAIREVYTRIFTGPVLVYVEFYDYTLHEAAGMFYVVGRERGYFRRDGIEVELAVRTSRIFRKLSGRWRQTHHHGSIESPALLDRYQRAVRGTAE